VYKHYSYNGFWMSASIVFLTACGGYATISAGQIGCKPEEITIEDDSVGWSSAPWIAKCRGKAFSCSAYSTGGDSSEAHCKEMIPEPAKPKQAPADAPTKASQDKNVPPPDFVERAYDDANQQQMVKASFFLGEQLHLRWIGKPQKFPGRVIVFLTGQSRDQELYKCKELLLFVNAKTERALESTTRTQNHDISIENFHDASVFLPLTQQFSSFGVQACGAKWRFSEEQIEMLKKFFIINSQLSDQLQNSSPQPQSKEQ
jgi:hypothetical protein